MNKILKKYTTIPEHLYINRNADKQLRQIIEDMQRPGYVLVARQMGKTNLLFHAKRTLENESRLFVYVDLSNSFDHERDCYRNIIDCVLEPNEELFESIEYKVHDIRDKNLQPHKEYSRSLREILNFFQGDLVIVLDEIDALRGAEYSDNIFAQIRSNYFSRTNFPVFERLTYILSGVIEPTELIKDRNKSPFNIGDKIYLDDFNFDEHESFIHKSQLGISNEISGEIYEWTNGNPRLTFDICSEIESKIIDGESISKVKIAEIIKNKYLTSYDIAPVDHIRELVKSNKKIRDAILNIHSKKYGEINDEIKDKLYLYGIISSDFRNDTVIKNPIISKSISEDWIQSINKESQSNLNYGLSLMDEKSYLEALNHLTDYLENSDPNKLETEICNYNIGNSLFHLNLIDEAIKYFSKIYEQELYKDNARFFLGMCLIKNGDIDSGKEILQEFLNCQDLNFASRNAIFNYANIIREEDPEQALTLYDKIVNSSSQIDNNLKGTEINKLYTSIFTYKALIYYKLRNDNNFISSIDSAIAHADISEKLYLDFLLYTLSKSNKDESLRNNITDSIINNELKLKDEDVFPCDFTYKNLLSYLNLIFDDNNLENYRKLLKYTNHNLLPDTSIAKIVIDIHKKFKEKNHLEYFIESSKEKDIVISDLLDIYRYICIRHFRELKEFYKYFYKYKDLIAQTDEIIKADIYIFTNAIQDARHHGKDVEALGLCSFLHEVKYRIKDESVKADFILIYFWMTSIYFENASFTLALKYANLTLELIEFSKNNNLSLIDSEGLKSIIEKIDSLKFKILSEKQYNRNDKVKVHYPYQGITGVTKEGKYKKFSSDIDNRKCFIVE